MQDGPRLWLEKWIFPPQLEEREQTRGLLLGYLLFGSAAIVALIGIINISEYLSDASVPFWYAALDIVCFLLFAILFSINRRGHVRIVSSCYLILCACMILFGFNANGLDRTFIVFAFPVMASSFLIAPFASFLFAAIAAAGYTILYIAGTPAFAFNYISLPSLFVIALVSGLTASILERQQLARVRVGAVLDEKTREIDFFFHSGIDLMCIVDKESRFRRLNSEWTKLFGYPARELEGKRILDFLHPEDAHIAEIELQSLAVATSRPNFLSRIRAQDGAYHWLEWKAQLIGDDIYAVARDITERKTAEVALQRAIRDWQTTFDSVGDAVLLLDRDFKMLRCNHACENILAQDVRDMQGKTPWELIRGVKEPEESFPEMRMRRSMRRESDLLRLQNRWLRITVDPIVSGEMQLAGAVCILTDVTEQRAAEESMRNSEERYQRITRTITDYIYHVRIENGRVIETTHGPGCVAVTGYTGEEMQADPYLWLRMVYPEDRPQVERLAEEILRGEEPAPIEHRLVRKDGVRRWVRNTPVIFRDAAGALLSYDGLIQDITDRKDAEEHLHEQHALALALSAASDLDACLRIGLEAAITIAEMDSGEMCLLEDQHGTLELIPRANSGYRNPMEAGGNWLAARQDVAGQIRDGKAVYLEESDLAQRGLEGRNGEGLRSFGCLPILHEESVIGCLCVSSHSAASIDMEHAKLLEAACAQIGSAVVRFKIELALRESEEHYRQLYAAESDAILLVEGETGKILEANQSATEMYGYSHEELLLLQSADLGGDSVDTGDSAKSGGDAMNEVITIPLRWQKKKDGSIFPAELTSRSFPYQGRPVHIVAIRDISARRKAEADLQASHEAEIRFSEKLTALIEVVSVLSAAATLNDLCHDMVFLAKEKMKIDRLSIWFVSEKKDRIYGNYGVDREGNLVDERSLDLPIDERDRVYPVVLGKEPIIWFKTGGLFTGPDMVGEGMQIVAGLYEADRVFGFISWDNLLHQQPFTEKDCELMRIFASVLGPMCTLKRAQEALTRLMEDLEQRVVERTSQLNAAATRLELANKELESFSYSISHDLRAPLRAIAGFTQVLLEEYGPQLDAEGQRIAGVISANAVRMSRLIDDLLAFSRLNRQGMQNEIIDMGKMAAEVYADLSTGEARTRIEFRCESLPQVNGDPAMIRQVWANLLSNAIKFSSKRDHARIFVRAEETPEEIQFSVADNGAGFDMRYGNKLFGVFQRLHGEGEFEGTGVGLAIVQRIIQRHNGRVWAEGELGKGAVFHFSLPRIPAVSATGT